MDLIVFHQYIQPSSFDENIADPSWKQKVSSEKSHVTSATAGVTISTSTWTRKLRTEGMGRNRVSEEASQPETQDTSQKLNSLLTSVAKDK